MLGLNAGALHRRTFDCRLEKRDGKGDEEAASSHLRAVCNLLGGVNISGMQSWLMLSSVFSPLSFCPLYLPPPFFLIAPGIVLVLADNKGDKCNAYCKSLWLGLGHDTCQPMINWLCVCSISNAKLQREGERVSSRENRT